MRSRHVPIAGTPTFIHAQHCTACMHPTLLPVPSVRYGRRPRRATRGSTRGDAPALADPPLKASPRPYPLRLGVLPIPAYCTPLSAPARPCIRAPPVLRALLCSPPLHCRAGAPRKRSACHATRPPGRGDISRRQRGGLTRSAIPRASGAGDGPTKLLARLSVISLSVRHRSPSAVAFLYPLAGGPFSPIAAPNQRPPAASPHFVARDHSGLLGRDFLPTDCPYRGKELSATEVTSSRGRAVVAGVWLLQ